MKKIIKRISVKAVNILPVIFWLCLIYSFDGIMGANATVLAMIIHESGHILCYFAISGELHLPRGDISGLRIEKNELRNYRQDILIYSAGIAFNLLATIAVLIMRLPQSDFKTVFITVNIATAISNMLPIEGYDGHRIIDALLSYFNAGKWAYGILEGISFVIVFLMCLIALFTVYTFGNGYWILGVFLFAVIGKLKKWLKYSNEKIF